MKSFVLTLFILPLLLGSAEHKERNYFDDNQKVVLELFTSQGCSSCPPADKLIKKVQSEDVITLSYHVDYWNYIGWEDPFSQSNFTEKQRIYAKKFNQRTIYTPEIVVNGKEHFVGSDQAKLYAKTTFYSQSKSVASVDILASNVKGNMVSYQFETLGDLSKLLVRAVLIIDERKTHIKRGENRNLTLVNNNIVIAEYRSELLDSNGSGEIQIPNIVKESDAMSLVLILENENLDILSAKKVGL